MIDVEGKDTRDVSLGRCPRNIIVHFDKALSTYAAMENVKYAVATA